MSKKIQIDFEEFREEFFENCDDLMQTAEDGILRLESEGVDPELVDDIFRCLHTIKGEAGILQFNIIKSLAHAMEDLMLGVKKGELDADGNVCGELFKALDLLARVVAEVREGEGTQLDIEPCCKALRSHIVSKEKGEGEYLSAVDNEGPPHESQDESTEKNGAQLEPELDEDMVFDENEPSYLVVVLKNIAYGLSVEHVRGINPILKTHYLPFVEKSICGAVNLRGEILPLLDLGILLGYDPVEGNDPQIVILECEHGRVGLLVEKVETLFRTQPNAIQPPSKLMQDLEHEILDGSLQQNDRLVHLLSVPELMKRPSASSPFNQD